MTVPGRVPPLGLVRNADADDLHEGFLVAAATAFVGIRIYPALTGYPQLGGHGLHIAHMLWGGLLMLVALVMALSFLGARVRMQVAIVGGLGFGAFIDELGKFITSDNDYFFRPTVALIYAIFVLLYLSFRAIGERGPNSPEVALAKAVDLVEAGLLRGFLTEDRERVLRLLNEGDPGNPLVGSLRQAVQRIAPAPETDVGLPRRAASALRERYDRIVHDRRFLWLVVALAVGHAVSGVVSLIGEIVSDPAHAVGYPAISFGDALKALSTALANGMVLVGAIRLRRSRLAAYVWFKRAVLVSLLLIQFIAFYENVLTAAWALLFNLALLAALNWAIGREEASSSGRIAAQPTAK